MDKRTVVCKEPSPSFPSSQLWHSCVYCLWLREFQYPCKVLSEETRRAEHYWCKTLCNHQMLSVTQKHFRLFCNKCKWQTRGQGWSQGQRLESNLYFLFMSCCNNFEGMKEISRNVRQGNLIRKLVHSFSDLFFDLLWNNYGAKILRWCKSINVAADLLPWGFSVSVQR